MEGIHCCCGSNSMDTANQPLESEVQMQVDIPDHFGEESLRDPANNWTIY